jgi:uncharacterized caspase-like protein
LAGQWLIATLDVIPGGRTERAIDLRFLQLITAYDGNKGQKNSPFAVALAAHLTTPGLDLRKAFGFVRDDVLKATKNKQEPFIYGSLGGEDVALVPAPAVVASPPTPAPVPTRRSATTSLLSGSAPRKRGTSS